MPPATAATEASVALEAPLGRPRSESLVRVGSALVLVPVVIGALALGGWPFVLLVALVSGIALWEWTSITGVALPWLRVAALLVLIAGLIALALGRLDWALAVIAIPALAALAAGLSRRPFLWAGLGLVYVAVPSAGIVLLRDAEPRGWAAVLFVLLVVWTTDTAAYVGGRSLGGPKLSPRISPKKTWSGALSGLGTAAVVGAIAASLTGAGGILPAFLLALLLSLATQAGDLFESGLKRRFGVKDSGAIIPGHGGVLDRIDGLYGAAALAWFIAALGLGAGILNLPGAALPGAAP
jgi:phosphatidate cytidylyltransferase